MNLKKIIYESNIRYIIANIKNSNVVLMEYKKKSLSKLDIKKDYEELDTRLASGWYVDDLNVTKKKIYKTKETSFNISKKNKSSTNNFQNG